jgi:DNA-directed RNA polymerase specialized sigma24 family protein
LFLTTPPTANAADPLLRATPSLTTTARAKETVEMPETLHAKPERRNDELEELLAALRRMISSLPEPHREALVLTGFDKLTQQELADRLKISHS